MFEFLKKKKHNNTGSTFSSFGVDMHCHLLPGLDDGCKTIEDSITMAKWFISLGYKKVICTPHVMGDLYKNNPEGINHTLEILKQELHKQKIPLEVSAAAEYYLDEWFDEKINNTRLLTFGNNFLLFEISYLSESPQLNNTIFDLKVAGYQPILAHPERYLFYHHNYSAFEDLVNRGVYIQINLLSLAGYYGKPVKKAAEFLVSEKMVHFAGTDMHHQKHYEALRKGLDSGAFDALLDQKLLNSIL